MDPTKAYSALLDLLPRNKHRSKRRKVGADDDVVSSGEQVTQAEQAPLKDDGGGDNDDDEQGQDAFDLQFEPGVRSEDKQVISADGVKYIVVKSDGRGGASLKQRLRGKTTTTAAGSLKQVEDHCLSYRDVVYPLATHDQLPQLRHIYTLHAANHVLKLRDRILKNNARSSEVEARDQGFTRPTVLLLLPTRNACLEVVNLLLGHLGPDQVENRKRFEDEFGAEEDPSRSSRTSSKPADFRAAFAGNTDDAFRIGLKVTRKTVKLYSAFYNSDVILASPLGLRTLKEYDFLSSIVVMVVESADQLNMQNWAHVEHVFDNLNLIPKEQHGCDFARVRSAFLDGKARDIRQTVLLSAYDFPEARALPLSNWSGSLKVVPFFDIGAIDRVGVSVVQQFSRFDSAAVADDPDRRFEYFVSTVVPRLGPGTLLFVPSYFDFCRVRNHLDAASSASASAATVESLSEYSSTSELTRGRHLFADSRVDVLVVTERLQHFRRYTFKGTNRLIFYQPPEHRDFYTELARATATDVKVLFSTWDQLRLERIVGTRRAAKMVRGGDSYEFS